MTWLILLAVVVMINIPLEILARRNRHRLILGEKALAAGTARRLVAHRLEAFGNEAFMQDKHDVAAALFAASIDAFELKTDDERAWLATQRKS